MPDALALLHADHEAVLDLLTRLGQTSGAVERGELAATAVKELRAHTRVEEDVFYPAVAESVPDGAGFVQVSREEHGKAAAQLDRLEKLSPEDRGFAPAAGELTRLVKEHVADEEMQLFPRVRTAMGAEQLAELGTRIEERKGMAAAGRRRSR
jgi:hemerythrin superfamily protein